MGDLSPEEFLRSLAAPVQILARRQEAQRRTIRSQTLPIAAAFVTAFVAQRGEMAFEDAAGLPEQEFLAAAKPVLDFLDARALFG